MWSELFLLNKEELLKQMELFENAFANLRKAIEDENTDEMRSLMKLSTEHRKRFDKEGK